MNKKFLIAAIAAVAVQAQAGNLANLVSNVGAGSALAQLTTPLSAGVGQLDAPLAPITGALYTFLPLTQTGLAVNNVLVTTLPVGAAPNPTVTFGKFANSLQNAAALGAAQLTNALNPASPTSPLQQLAVTTQLVGAGVNGTVNDTANALQALANALAAAGAGNDPFGAINQGLNNGVVAFLGNGQGNNGIIGNLSGGLTGGFNELNKTVQTASKVLIGDGSPEVGKAPGDRSVVGTVTAALTTEPGKIATLLSSQGNVPKAVLDALQQVLDGASTGSELLGGALAGGGIPSTPASLETLRVALEQGLRVNFAKYGNIVATTPATLLQTLVTSETAKDIRNGGVTPESLANALQLDGAGNFPSGLFENFTAM